VGILVDQGAGVVALAISSDMAASIAIGEVLRVDMAGKIRELHIFIMLQHILSLHSLR
jgi:hypothetical protein